MKRGHSFFCIVAALILQLSATANPPNILLFMADDLTWHDHGCYGNEDVGTPNIDRFATQGMRFEHCYNSAPMCAPTRMSLYTGIHPVRNGAHPNHSAVYPHIRSLPHYLNDLGYETALLGKRHEMPQKNFPFKFLGGRHHDNGQGVDLELDKAREFIAGKKQDPWCLVVTSNQPHTPWNRGDSSVYANKKLKLPEYLVDTMDTRVALMKYYAEITYMDQQFGTCLKHLEQTGQAENTIVIYLSEQGSNFPHCKWTCYDSGLRSACVVRWPGNIRAGSVTPAMVQYIDILPTLLHVITGSEANHEFDGRSFLNVLQGNDHQHREHVFGIQTSNGIGGGPEAYGIRTVRNERYRLIWNLNSKNKFSNGVTKRFEPYLSWERLAKKGNDFAWDQAYRYIYRPEFELYDMRNDPFEMKNLAEQPALRSEISALKSKIEDWMKQQGDQGTATELAARDRQMKRTYR